MTKDDASNESGDAGDDGDDDEWKQRTRTKTTM